MKQNYHTMKHFFILLINALPTFVQTNQIFSTKFKCYEGN